MSHRFVIWERCDECNQEFDIDDEWMAPCEYCDMYLCQSCYKKHLCLKCVDNLVEFCTDFLKRNKSVSNI